MILSGEQRQKLRDALISAFPSKASLEQMLAFQLNKNLDVIAGGTNLKEVVFNLIKTADAEGWVEKLIYAAREENPGNQSLKDLAAPEDNSVQPNIRQKPHQEQQSVKLSKHIQIFLAHANEDKPEVEKIYKHLENKGYKPWMDKKDLLPGQNWREETPKAIKQSQIFIAFFSQISVSKQGYMQKELRLALNHYAQMPPGKIFLIPLKLDDCEIPPLQLPELGMNLQDLHWLDYRESDALEKLVRSIESIANY
ncbi:toll/interleukin-1 receptor domain-containing protein [Mastigocoleus testarum]|uniref:TIR domain-containing protein n=1 Tax=Mastigocoleus testarum BC008 TaxID=371196 RepID=A0A0V7ZSX5_9CYAN|nr:toll/interleukin-1 receptor domain-containing protein [Mastigocoleus testarum]KST67302.1 hypothetical protein BC008_29380 [Mastigocoleus testarum BC008]